MIHLIKKIMINIISFKREKLNHMFCKQGYQILLQINNAIHSINCISKGSIQLIHNKR